MESRSYAEKNTGQAEATARLGRALAFPKQASGVFQWAVEKRAAEAMNGKRGKEERPERRGSERFSLCEHRWRGDGKIIESRLSHRQDKRDISPSDKFPR